MAKHDPKPGPDDKLATISHDLRTPLTGIAVAAQVIERSLKGSEHDERLRQQAETIKQSVGLVDGLVKDLLDAARPELPTENPAAPLVLRAFANGGECGAVMAAFDWSRASLGPLTDWPVSLRTLVAVMLASPYPVAVLWGDDSTVLYNDSYRPFIGGKHPVAIGQPASQIFPEAWDFLSGMFAEMRRTGKGTLYENLQVSLARHSSEWLEELYFTFSYIPVRAETDDIAGVVAFVSETTLHVLAGRRLKSLRELSMRMAVDKNIEGAFDSIEDVLLQAQSDVPFALLYRIEGGMARLVACSSIDRGGIVSAEMLDVDASPWPLASVARSKREVVVELDPARFGELPSGQWEEPARAALVLPVDDNDVLVAGLSPRLPLDDDYRQFLQQLARQMATGIAGARLYEEERKRAEALAELDQAKTAFFSNISHEFRTPLTLILGPVEDALADAGRSLAGEQLELVRRNALRLYKMVNTLLDFSRMEAGRAQATFVPTDLSGFTTDLASAFRSAVQSAGLALTVDCPPLPEPVYVDPEMWEKIVLNLLSNAVKYTHQGGITVRLCWEDGQAVLTVADTGVGIPEDELPNIFQRFYRVRRVDGRSHEGSGIGLALVNELVMLHGGSAEVASEVGEGSTFTVRLPRGAAHLPAEHVDHTGRPHSTAAGATPFVEEARRWVVADTVETEEIDVGAPVETAVERLQAHILLADDNSDLRAYVAGLLRRFFTRVDTVADGRAALDAARAEPPDLILSDVMMPKMDGFDLVRELRADERTRAVRVVLLSARAGEDATLAGLESGADDYLVKPFSTRELIARVRSQIEMRRVRREALHREFDNERLRDTLAARDEFLSMASHELRTPLTALRLQAQAFLRGADDDIAIRRAETFLRSVDRLVQLVNDLLDVSRITGGRLSLLSEEVDLTKVVSEALEKVRASAVAQGTEIVPSLPGPVIGRWDRGRLEQVVAKLLGNALKYGAGKPVEVSVEEGAGIARLTVRDRGIGIPPDEQARIFERFERAVPMQHFGGLGLGLWIARQLVEAMDGSIHLDSVEGEGATFTIELPRG
ncbi:MAG TPA: ATP-binding protein [Gammaproteobacteria bacterium]|nr:ATP-binding protein [Gammaproteobacteria bacterium]